MEFQTANIKYCGIEDKGITVNLIDENKKKWTIWKADYKDKTKESEVYRALQNFKLGESFGVSFSEKEESFIGKEGKPINFKRKTIYSIMPLITAPSSKEGQSTQTPNEPTYTQDKLPEYKSRNFKQEGLEKCLWNYWLEMTVNQVELTSNWKELVTQAFDEINKFSEARFAKGWDKAVAVYGADEPLPEEPPQEKGINVEDIPF